MGWNFLRLTLSHHVSCEDQRANLDDKIVNLLNHETSGIVRELELLLDLLGNSLLFDFSSKSCRRALPLIGQLGDQMDQCNVNGNRTS